jgi:uncharacterized protein DUF6541
MTAATSLSRRGWETARSLRQRLAAVPLATRLLAALVLIATLVDGLRALVAMNMRGDLLYHWALARTILRGELPPGGPYAGLPAYYPPGFHLLLAAGSKLTTLDVTAVTTVLSVAWLPVLPLTTYVLARRLTGRPVVAIIAAVLTVFGGAYDLSANRLWVNSLFPAGHEAFPLYPRDVVFALLPLAAWAFVRAIDPSDARCLRWSLLAGVLLGVCGLFQVQLLLPIPFAFLAPAVVAWRRDPRRGMVLAGSLVVSGVAALLLVAPWIIDAVALIRRNGGVVLESSENLQPARFGFWSYPTQFGLLLPLALVGCGVVLLFLRRADGPRSAGRAVGAWRPSPPEAPLLLVAWFAVPFVLAVFYSPSWPLEDALRPQRLWLIAGQPAMILAAIGLVTVAEDVVLGTLRRVRLLVPVVVVILLVITVPTTFATQRLLWTIWPTPQYANLRLDVDHVPDFGSLLGTSGPRETVLSYEDWSSVIWYETGESVVAVKPPGYAKLAFDPAVFTGRSQDVRRADVQATFQGDVTALAATADRYAAATIVLARRGDRVGLVDAVASLALDSSSGASARAGNGWDVVDLAAGGHLVMPLQVSGPIDLELRFEGTQNDVPLPARRVQLLAGRDVVSLVVPPSGADEWQVVRASVTLQPGADLVVQAQDPVALQSIRGFVPLTGPPAGWVLRSETTDAYVFARSQ